MKKSELLNAIDKDVNSLIGYFNHSENKIPKYLVEYLTKIFEIIKKRFDIIEPVKGLTFSKIVPAFYIGLQELEKVRIDFEI